MTVTTPAPTTHPADRLPAQVDLAIVGGGILGLAVARAILEARPDARVAVLEREPELATHQTGRNSGVLHAGLYYQPGSLKARFCREGKAALEAYADEKGIPYDRCGKLVVADRRDGAARPGATARARRGQRRAGTRDRRAGADRRDRAARPSGPRAVEPVDRDHRLPAGRPGLRGRRARGRGHDPSGAHGAGHPNGRRRDPGRDRPGDGPEPAPRSPAPACGRTRSPR